MIPNETITVYGKGQSKPETIKKPLARTVELIEVNLKVRKSTLFDPSTVTRTPLFTYHFFAMWLRVTVSVRPGTRD